MFAKGTSGIIVLPFVFIVILLIEIVLLEATPLTPFGFWLYLVLFFMFIFGFMGVYFFRDPEREIGKGIVSAADGVVTKVERNGDKVKVIVFMNVHDVHVNRAPLSGKIKKIKHFPGSHMPAYKKESERNERVTIDWETDIGPVRTVQIAGLVARRIVPYVKKGQSLKKGERIGIIRLGSRVDVDLPSSKVKVKVGKGQKVLAGITTIATLKKGRGSG